MASVKDLAPVGKIMNSCIASPFPPCFPPLMTFSEGQGKMYLPLLFFLPLKLARCSQSGIFLEAAPARATAIETARTALAPNLFLGHPNSFLVPSNYLTMKQSISVWLTGSLPWSAFEMISLTFDTALETPLPRQAFLSPSLSSSASYFPVEAPDGTAALKTPSWVVTSAQTVGFPRESKICLALILVMVEKVLDKFRFFENSIKDIVL